MSSLWSGGMSWTAALVALLLSSQATITAAAGPAAANPAIIVTPTDAGYYDVALDIAHLGLPQGLSSWDQLAFTSLTAPVFSQPSSGSLTAKEWEQLAVVDLASGRRCESTPGCMANITEHYDILAESDLQKRIFFAAAFRAAKWVTRKGNALKAGGLGALANTVSGVGNGIIDLSRAAICETDSSGNQACLSWAGAAHAIKKAVALEVIHSGQGTFGGEAVSGEEYKALLEKNSKRKRATYYDVCLSSIPHCPT